MLARVAVAWLFLSGVSLTAQDFISARAGYVNYVEGRAAEARRQLHDGEAFQTQRGRAELLLTAGSFLRLDDNSQIRMLSTRLSDVQVELLEGKAGLEVNEKPKLARLAMVWNDRSFPIDHKGLYRFQAENGVLRVGVQDGKLHLPGGNTTLKAGEWVQITSGGVSRPAKFDRRAPDSFDLWSKSRAGLLAEASFRSAHSFTGPAFRDSFWAFNSFLGGYTYMPYSPYIMSPWGFPFYSPRYIWIYSPPRRPGGGLGAGGGGSTALPGAGAGAGSGGSGNGAARAPSPPSVKPPRGGDARSPRVQHQ